MTVAKKRTPNYRTRMLGVNRVKHEARDVAYVPRLPQPVNPPRYTRWRRVGGRA